MIFDRIDRNYYHIVNIKLSAPILYQSNLIFIIPDTGQAKPSASAVVVWRLAQGFELWAPSSAV
ncbi:MAG: hypothetical protein Q8M95_00790 [Candidatus Methanoperedens sp.]|nr:hypothetical protein [Candidatus Methanoperedenaceae archaeon]MDP3103125.1 hypothetical protein [Candidatus Methanoperedens sp.]